MNLAQYMAKAGTKDDDMARSLGISRSYVTQIRNGRAPSLVVALRIRALTGLKLGPIEGASDAEIAALKRVAARAA